MKRDRLLTRGLIAAVAVGVFVGCGPDASSVPSQVTVPAVVSTTGSPAATDFGAKYVGQPVAFWFWAPY